MRDPRIMRPLAMVSYQQQARLSAEALGRTLGYSESIVLATEAYWNKWQELHSRNPDLEITPDNLSVVINADKFSIEQQQLLHAIRCKLCNKNDAIPENVRTLVRIIVGRALGRATARAEKWNLQKLLRIAIDADQLGCWSDFVENFCSSLSPTKKSHWCELLDAWPTDVASYLQDSNRSTALALALQRHHSELEPSTILVSFSDNVDLSIAIINRIRILFALDPTRAVLAVEKFPAQGIRETTLDLLHIAEDRNLLLTSIQRCPSAFRDDKWKRGSTLILLLAARIVMHARLLHNALSPTGWSIGATAVAPDQAELQQLRNVEIPQWFELSFTTLCERPNDGVRIALELGMDLARRCQYTGGAEPRNAWSVEAVALDALAKILLQRQVDDPTYLRNTLLSSVSKPQREGGTVENSELPALLLAIQLTGAGPDSESRYLYHWNWYLELLEKMDYGIISDVNSSGGTRFTARVICTILTTNKRADQTQWISQEWSRGWERLYKQRQRARFLPLDYKLVQPSFHLLRVGHTCLQCLNLGLNYDGSRNLWNLFYRSARHLVLEQPWKHIPPGFIREWALLWAYVPALFGENWASKLIECHDDFVASPAFALLSWAHLLQNGKPRDELVQSLRTSRIDLDALTISMREWFKLRGGQQTIEGWPLEKLLDRLGSS